MLSKTEVELSSISIANDKSEVLQNQIIQLYEKRQSLERNIKLLLSYVSNFPVYKSQKTEHCSELVFFQAYSYLWEL